ncbi:MAG: 50S ribosomal protein L18 [Alphaproteobacteria bacterium]
MVVHTKLFDRRQERVRFRIRRSNPSGRLRLSVFRSNRYIYAQLIDDNRHCTLVSASSIEKDLKDLLKGKNDKGAAEEVGKRIAERALKLGHKDVVFDRGGRLFHGRVKALAEAARAAGLFF